MIYPKSTICKLRDEILKGWTRDLMEREPENSLEVAESAAFTVYDWVQRQLGMPVDEENPHPILPSPKEPRIRGKRSKEKAAEWPDD